MTQASPFFLTINAHAHFHNINSKYFFSNFLCSSHPIDCVSCKFKNYLSSVIVLSSFNLVDQLINSQQIVSNADSTVKNCCFENITHTGDGAAIWQDTAWIKLTLNNNAFRKCVANNGGAIYSNSQNLGSSFDEFAECKSTGTGASIYVYKVREFLNFKMEDGYVHHCESGTDSLSLYSENNDIIGANVTDNKSSRNAGISIKGNQWSRTYKYINNVKNDGGYIMYIYNASRGRIAYINFVNNNANVGFLINTPDQTDPRQPDITYFSFAFYGNTPIDYKLIAVRKDYRITFEDCFFEFPFSEAVVRLNSHGLSGGTFSTSHTNQITVSVNQHICVAKPTQSPMATQSEIQISSIEKEPTGPFTASFTFTASNYFTPNRTAFPDGMNLIRANIKQYNMFAKEELIKAAAPATISLILIIVAIIFTVYYIRKRIQQVQPPDPPDFDSSISDRISGNDSDSLDFYTYSYSSTYSDNNSHDDSEYSDFVPDDMLDMKNELGRYHHLF